MKPQLEIPKNTIDTDAQDFAEEVRYAVTHHGRELHPEHAEKPVQPKDEKPQDAPWQVD